jgi:membrane protease YdiL (CAAX protease family)
LADASALVTAVLLACMFLVLGELVRALVMGDKLGERQPRRPIVVEPHVAGMAVVFLLIYVAPALVELAVGSKVPEKVSDAGLVIAIAMNFVILAAVLPLLAVTGRNRLADYGIEGRGWRAEVRFGALAYLLATPIVMGVLLAMSNVRGPQTEHPFLKLLTGASGAEIVGVAFAAVVAAPLTEELIFRVLFQGLLESLVPAWLAVLLAALAFAAMHGRYDAIPLFPLAIALGLLYHVRRSYVAVATTHALFNATFLVLALEGRS